MPRHNFEPARGKIELIEIDSAALRDNMLGDPARRQVAVYLPKGYDDAADGCPLFVDLAGFTGSGLKHLAWQAFGETLPQRIDRLIGANEMGPVVMAFPDCFTSLGGNQYINSSAMGRWEDYLIEDMIPALEARFRVRKGRRHRAVFGRSSGGYGALVHAMRHADVWGAAACHSADMDFNILYRGDLPRTLNVLARHERSIEKFLDSVALKPKLASDEFHALMILAMAATYAPESDAPRGIRLPVDLETCTLDPVRWERWLEHDPLRMVEDTSVQANLKKLSGLYLDCGSHDQYAIHYGMRALSRRLGELEVEHTYEEFPDNHSNIDYRLDHSLPFLYEATR